MKKAYCYLRSILPTLYGGIFSYWIEGNIHLIVRLSLYYHRYIPKKLLLLLAGNYLTSRPNISELEAIKGNCEIFLWCAFFFKPCNYIASARIRIFRSNNSWKLEIAMRMRLIAQFICVVSNPLRGIERIFCQTSWKLTVRII